METNSKYVWKNIFRNYSRRGSESDVLKTDNFWTHLVFHTRGEDDRFRVVQDDVGRGSRHPWCGQNVYD